MTTPHTSDKELSDCCHAPVEVVGRTTKHYECTQCHEACGLFYHFHFPAKVQRSALLDELENADRRTLETIAALLNGDHNQVEVVRGYIHNKLKMYEDNRKARGDEYERTR